jgi:hypothetical protein
MPNQRPNCHIGQTVMIQQSEGDKVFVTKVKSAEGYKIVFEDRLPPWVKPDDLIGWEVEEGKQNA